MLSQLLSSFYQRDFQKLIEEIGLFKNEEDLWRVAGTIKNPAGNLTLHLIGGSSFLFGTQIAKTGYVRNRDLEFTKTGVPKAELLKGLEDVLALITQTLSTLTDDDMAATYPIPFDNKQVTVSYIVMQLLVHLNYHLGQINYLRRFFE